MDMVLQIKAHGKITFKEIGGTYDPKEFISPGDRSLKAPEHIAK